MSCRMKSALWGAFGLWLMLLAGGACQDGESPEPGRSGSSGGDASSNAGDADGDGATAARQRAAVTGTVAYRERIALSPDAVLVLELRDVSLIDGPSKLLAEQVITNPGQPPISFRLEYDPADIRGGNTYAVQARIKYRDGSLAFINDVAYEVLTAGRPSEVDMVLTMVGPPPDPNAPPPAAAVDGDWVDVPARVRRVEIEEYDEGYLFRVVYFQPGGADCFRQSDGVAELVGFNIRVTVNSLEKRGGDGSPACASGPQEGEVEIPIEGPFAPGETYRVRVNDGLTNTFTPPREGFPDSRIVPSPIEDAQVVVLEIYPPRYDVVVFSALPKGSSCSRFDGFSIERSTASRIDLLVTHHEVTAQNIACTEDYPIVETAIPLGSEFEPGREYTVHVNDVVLTFRAQ